MILPEAVSLIYLQHKEYKIIVCFQQHLNIYGLVSPLTLPDVTEQSFSYTEETTYR